LIEKASENIIENNFDKLHPSHHLSNCTPNRNQLQTHSEYHVVHGWPIVPDNELLDEVSAVAVDSA
jgi:hypothetical protein